MTEGVFLRWVKGERRIGRVGQKRRDWVGGGRGGRGGEARGV